ncbi:MAG: hypothetical protein LBG75_02050 [Candidatus Nomurabacteria bacterium]|jgi:Tfp pilus assembly protein PilX|nr:hypothetical protein [Candidatus Nomurabacteria bacterium]
MQKTFTKFKDGAVSIYVVIFTALLVSIITISFVRIMVGDQRQSTNADLSQSAYDSALAGVEDAKLALLKFKKDCQMNKNASAGCTTLYNQIVSNECNQFREVLDGTQTTNKEITVQRDQGADKDMDQAYTCVKVALETEDYLGTLGQGQPYLIPLVAEMNDSGERKKIDTIEVSWYVEGDAEAGKTGIASPLGASAGVNPTTESKPLQQTEEKWNGKESGKTAPSLLRFQLVQADNSFTLDNFNGGNSVNTDRGTILLYPIVSDTVVTDIYALGKSAVYGQVDAPTYAKCGKDFNKVYACTATLKMPGTVGNQSTSTIFAKLTGYYHSSTTYKVIMKGVDGKVIRFDSVQPSVDATGRANDLYRRVDSRIQMYGDVVLPEFSVDMSEKGTAKGLFCKGLTVTDKTTDTGNTGCDS